MIISKKLVIVFSAFVLVIVLALFAIYNVGGWLKGSDVPEFSQAIIILAGPPTRSFYAADLYNQGYAKEIYISRPVREHYFEDCSMSWVFRCQEWKTYIRRCFSGKMYP